MADALHVENDEAYAVEFSFAVMSATDRLSDGDDVG